jgi:hypothetical protein
MNFNKLSSSAKIAVQNNFANVPKDANGMMSAFVSVSNNVDAELLLLGAISSAIGNQGNATFIIKFSPSNLAQITEINGVNYIDFGNPTSTLQTNMSNPMNMGITQQQPSMNQTKSTTSNTGNWVSNNKGLVVILGLVAVLGFMKYKKMI